MPSFFKRNHWYVFSLFIVSVYRKLYCIRHIIYIIVLISLHIYWYNCIYIIVLISFLWIKAFMHLSFYWHQIALQKKKVSISIFFCNVSSIFSPYISTSHKYYYMMLQNTTVWKPCPILHNEFQQYTAKKFSEYM